MRLYLFRIFIGFIIKCIKVHISVVNYLMNLMVLIILTESLKIGFDRLILQKEIMLLVAKKLC